jgi:signal transduction histidine kinase
MGAAALALLPMALHADDGVTPEEVIAKVRAAAADLARDGEAGLAAIGAEGSPYIWKDTYVFVYDCAADVIVAHAVAASRGLKISGLRDADGKAYGAELCTAAGVPGGSWSEYVWPRPVEAEGGELAYTEDAFRKVSYMLAVEGQPYQVGAGIYNDPLSLADLDALVPKAD